MKKHILIIIFLFSIITCYSQEEEYENLFMAIDKITEQEKFQNFCDNVEDLTLYVLVDSLNNHEHFIKTYAHKEIIITSIYYLFWINTNERRTLENVLFSINNNEIILEFKLISSSIVDCKYILKKRGNSWKIKSEKLTVIDE